jgi:hypothetical protein
MTEPDPIREAKPCPVPSVVAVAILERAVLDVLVEQGDRNPDLNFVGLRYIMRETGLGLEMVRALVRQLRDNGLAIYSAGLWDDEGRPAGAGYAASPEAMRRRLALTMTPRKEPA